MEKRKTRRSGLRILTTGDPQSMFHHFTAKEILKKLGPPRQLLSTSTKLEKSRSVGVLSRVLYLTSGVFCPQASPACLRLCLGHTSGRMTMLQSANARDQRSALYLEDPEHFLSLLRGELKRLEYEAAAAGLMPAVRLNGTSDIPWESLHPEVFEEFSERITFYDYTKVFSRMKRFLMEGGREKQFPRNYNLTYSLDESNAARVEQVLGFGGNVAVVFWPQVPVTWQGFRVVDGDRHDARFLDPKRCIVGLRAKGTARNDDSGFVVNVADASALRKQQNAA